MTQLLHDLLHGSADRDPNKAALIHREHAMSYGELAQLVRELAQALISAGLERQDRVATYLPKTPENVATMFATTQAGGAFVPVNPLLKSEQVTHILDDCDVRVLVTSGDRLAAIADAVEECRNLQLVVVVGEPGPAAKESARYRVTDWESFRQSHDGQVGHPVIDQDMASIFYTSGSTGKPKGVVLSHRNMVSGAKSVAQYLRSSADDRVLAVLPFSFDYGFSQLSISFHAGSTVCLMDYLFPQDVIKVLDEQRITGLAGVPPLWVQLAKLEWPESVRTTLRYITNSGGAMPQTVLADLRAIIPDTDVFLMYGLTEAFRSTYLDPAEVDDRPESIGKAIPNAEIMVIDDEGRICAPGEPGELVHRGALVSLGYWNDPERTAARFRPVPAQIDGITNPELAVWSGDTVKMDEDGYLYFVGRLDEMIKTSSYRVSPTEVEEAAYNTGQAAEVVAMGVPDDELGQAIVLAVVPSPGNGADDKTLVASLRKNLPNFMIPKHIVWFDSFPRNPNGKIDRQKVNSDAVASLIGKNR